MRAVLSFLLGIVVALPVAAQEKPHIFIAASAAWRQSDEGDGAKAEAEVRAVEIAADFSHSCGSVIVTADYKEANYIAEFSRHVKAVPFDAVCSRSNGCESVPAERRSGGRVIQSKP